MSDVDENTNVIDTSTMQVPLSPSWPRDVYGITSELRKALVRATARLNGDPKKMEVFMETVRTGAAWAKDRLEVQAALKEGLLNRLETVQALVQEQSDKDHAQGGRNATTDEVAAAQVDAGVGPAKA